MSIQFTSGKRPEHCINLPSPPVTYGERCLDLSCRSQDNAEIESCTLPQVGGASDIEVGSDKITSPFLAASRRRNLQRPKSILIINVPRHVALTRAIGTPYQTKYSQPCRGLPA
jgi:hypothetical protein